MPSDCDMIEKTNVMEEVEIKKISPRKEINIDFGLYYIALRKVKQKTERFGYVSGRFNKDWAFV